MMKRQPTIVKEEKEEEEDIFSLIDTVKMPRLEEEDTNNDNDDFFSTMISFVKKEEKLPTEIKNPIVIVADKPIEGKTDTVLDELIQKLQSFTPFFTPCLYPQKIETPDQLFPKSSAYLPCVSFAHNHEMSYAAGTYTIQNDDIFTDSSTTTTTNEEIHIPKCARDKNCVGMTMIGSISCESDETAFRGRVIRAWVHPEEKKGLNGGQQRERNRLCLYCYLDLIHDIVINFQTGLSPQLEQPEIIQQFMVEQKPGEYTFDSCHTLTVPFTGIVAPIPFFRPSHFVWRLDPNNGRYFVDHSCSQQAVPDILSLNHQDQRHNGLYVTYDVTKKR